MIARAVLLLLAAVAARGADNAAPPPKLSFVNDIVPIFTKSGCANSNCHGSIRGQNGFKLSLFGYEPELDYQAIVKDQNGRRDRPARSGQEPRSQEADFPGAARRRGAFQIRIARI